MTRKSALSVTFPAHPLPHAMTKTAEASSLSIFIDGESSNPFDVLVTLPCYAWFVAAPFIALGVGQVHAFLI